MSTQATRGSRLRHAAARLKKTTLSVLLATGAFAAQAVPVTISGMVYNDGNGLRDTLINGTPLSQAEGNPLYIYLLDINGMVRSKATVQSDGSYTLTGESNTNYSLNISTATANVFDMNPTLGLPPSYVTVGIGDGNAGQAFSGNGAAITTTDSSMSDMKFALDMRPNGNSYNYLADSTYRDSSQRFMVPAGAFNGSDPEDGAYSPGFMNRELNLYQANNCVVYYNDTALVLSGTATVIRSFHPALLRVVPVSGANNFSFTYGTVDNAGVTELAPKTVGITVSTSPLPVVLSAFTARWSNDAALLEWTTDLEQNSDYFSVERSTDGKVFESIGRVAAGGELHQAARYSFSDASAPARCYYRLKLVDKGGDYAYSAVVALGKSTGNAAPSVQLFPNPATDRLTVRAAEAASLKVELISSNGTLLHAAQVSAAEAVIRTDALPAGNYMVRIFADDAAPLTRLLTVRH